MSSSSGFKHNGWMIALIVSTVISFLLIQLLNLIASAESLFGDLEESDFKKFILSIFTNSTGGVSDYYVNDITPSGWTFSIWGVIYVWQALWLLYSLVSICRKGNDGYLYNNPRVIQPIVFAVYIVNMCLNVAWLFLFDRFLPTYALAVLALIVFTLHVGLFFTHRHLDNIAALLINSGQNKDIWMIRLFVHNGLAVYAAWTSIATLLNTNIVMIYEGDVDIQLGGSISLGILGLEILIYVALDMFFLDRYTRYTITPYFVVILALTGSITKNWDWDNRNSIITAVLLGVAGFCALAKVVMLVIRHIRKPLYQHLEVMKPV